jgi:predicted cobalt transporter CbtA
MNNTLFFIIITCITASISGLLYALLNFLLVESYIDKAIELEVERLIMEGESIDPNENASYRLWQKEGSILGFIILTLGVTSVFAIVYSYTNIKISPIKKGILLAIILWGVLFLVPFLKYPANPPAVGDPSTIYYRQFLYIGVLGISGSTALLSAYISKKLRYIAPIIYVIVITLVYIFFPDNPDEITISLDLINKFRVTTVISSFIAWLSIGIIFGILYNRFKIYLERKV